MSGFSWVYAHKICTRNTNMHLYSTSGLYWASSLQNPRQLSNKRQEGCSVAQLACFTAGPSSNLGLASQRGFPSEQHAMKNRRDASANGDGLYYCMHVIIEMYVTERDRRMFCFIPKISLDGKSRNLNSRVKTPIRARSAIAKCYLQNNLTSRPKHTLQICISCENVSLIGCKKEVEWFNYKMCQHASGH